jgi:hypothetical protein
MNGIEDERSEPGILAGLPQESTCAASNKRNVPKSTDKPERATLNFATEPDFAAEIVAAVSVTNHARQ